MTRHRIRAALAAGCLLAFAPVVRAADGTPDLVDVSTVAPTILALTVDCGSVQRGQQVPYHARRGDRIDTNNVNGSRFLHRLGQALGTVVGRQDQMLMPFDTFSGAGLDLPWATNPATYSLVSSDDPDFDEPRHPRSVQRKSRPTGLARLGPWSFASPVRHTLYLWWDRPLQGGRHYTLRVAGDRWPPRDFRHDPFLQRSEAVHVSQLGFHPDDPVKVGFLSVWLGDGGAHAYARGIGFVLIDVQSGRTAFTGSAVLAKAARDYDEDPYARNYNGTDVYRLDFSAFRTPGRYRLHVKEVGCSDAFRVDTNVWPEAFTVAARGFYHQRSGIALGPPCTDFVRPRGFHPDDGLQVFASTCSLMDSGNGLNARGNDPDNFTNLRGGLTDGVVSNAWGGYHDAGDWDRRIQHLQATRLLLELAQLFPDFARDVALNIPESTNTIPDLVDEAMWNLDCYRRMQLPEGSIRGGIESAEHPRVGEGSWQESLPVMAYAPDPWSSFIYAGDAARLAGVLRQYQMEALAAVYHESALRAMSWAERDLAAPRSAPLPHAVADARNLAAAELYALSGAARWHQVFLATTAFRDRGQELAVWQHHDQRDAAFVYLRMDSEDVDADVAYNAQRALLREADTSLALGERTGFGWTKLNPWEPVGYGRFSVPHVRTLLRAHALTQQAKYLAAAVRACQTGAGANPLNLCYTTGLGRSSPLNPLCEDARVLGKGPPPGIPVYGPADNEKVAGYFGFQIVAENIYPPIAAWPAMECWFDTYLSPATCEYTIMETLGPNCYAWGYLAACARAKKR